jgi:hypothetical protein
MKHRMRGLALALALALSIGGFVGAQSTEPSQQAIDEEAMAILMRFAEFLAKAERFSLKVEIGFDVLQEWGQKIEFGASRKAIIRRPDRARMEFKRRDGAEGGFIFDGKQISVFNRIEKVYATAPKSGNLDAALDYLIEELDMPTPLSDLFYSDVPSLLREKVGSLRYIGEATVAGHLCDHLAEPVLRRIVITHPLEEAQPQFWAQFLEWDFSPDVPDSLFEFKPPKGAERIPFVPRKLDVSTEGDKP